MALSVSAQPEQKNVCANAATSTVFFQDQSLAYNYKTQQWSYLLEVDGAKFFDTQSADKIIGIVERAASDAIVMWDQDSSGLIAGNPRFTTGDFELTPGQRSLVDSARVIGNGATPYSTYPRIGHRDVLTDARVYSSATTANTRTGRHNYRSATAPPEGRYHSVDLYFDSAFTSVVGAEFDFTPAGEV